MADTNPLGELIDIARRANGWSDEDVAVRARRRDEKLVKSTISEIRRNGLRTITPGLIRGLAAGLDLPAGQVLRAALRTLGLDEGAETSLVDAIRADPYLPAFAKRQMIATVEMARAEAEELEQLRTRDNDEDQEPQQGQGRPTSSGQGRTRGSRGTSTNVTQLPERNGTDELLALAEKRAARKAPDDRDEDAIPLGPVTPSSELPETDQPV